MKWVKSLSLVLALAFSGTGFADDMSDDTYTAPAYKADTSTAPVFKADTSTAPVYKADTSTTVPVYEANTSTAPAYDPDDHDVMMDAVFLRPLGLVGIVVGSAVFVALSPLVALAAIPEPHDAFERLADTIVIKPVNYTFKRPVGDYDYNKGSN